MNKMFRKLENYMLGSIWETNMIYYQRIIKSMTDMRSDNRRAFFKVQNHIQNNLAMEYSADTLFDIFYRSSFVNYGRDLYFERLQNLIGWGTFADQITGKLSGSKEVVFKDGRIILKTLIALGNLQSRFDDFQVNFELRQKLVDSLENKHIFWRLEDFAGVIQRIVISETRIKGLLLVDADLEPIKPILLDTIFKTASLNESCNFLTGDQILSLLKEVEEAFGRYQMFQLFAQMAEKLEAEGILRRSTNLSLYLQECGVIETEVNTCLAQNPRYLLD